MKTIIASLIAYTVIAGLYDLHYTDIDGNDQAMSQYQGKKILLVNIATGSSGVSQLAALQQLQQAHADSLVVIGFPSNSFGHESRGNAAIKQFCQANYGVTFRLADKNPVNGPGAQPVYQWLTHIQQNGVWGDSVKNDFQKFLINESGQLTGIFAPSVNPLGPEITGALDNN